MQVVVVRSHESEGLSVLVKLTAFHHNETFFFSLRFAADKKRKRSETCEHRPKTKGIF